MVKMIIGTIMECQVLSHLNELYVAFDGQLLNPKCAKER